MLLSRVLVFGLVLLLIQIARESATTVERFAVCKRCAANAWFKALAAQKECTREACGARRTLATASTTQTRIFIYHCGNRVCIPCVSARFGTRSMTFLSAATTQLLQRRHAQMPAGGCHATPSKSQSFSPPPQIVPIVGMEY